MESSKNHLGLCKTKEINEESYVTGGEIRAALQRAINFAPRPHGIRHEDMRSLADKGVASLAKVFKNNIQNGTIEENWLHNYLIPLRKTCKYHTKLQDYLIITILNTVGKLLGKDNCKEIFTSY